MAPLAASIVNPEGALKLPPVYAPVPLKLTACDDPLDEQKGPAYEIVAVGTAVMTTVAVVDTAEQPPDAGVV